MAGASFMTSLLKKLSSLIPQASSSTSSNQELHELGRIMSRIHDVLDDAEERDATDKYSEQLRLRELKEAAYDAEDVIDEYEYEVLHAQVKARRRLHTTASKKDGEVFNPNFDLPNVSISYQLSRRANEIRKRFEDITSEWERISLKPKDGKRRRVEVWKPKVTTSYFDDVNIFGREEEKRMIIEWLLKEDVEQCTVSVLPIVGMGGIGKTTVVQMVCNDPIVHKKFGWRGWVCVSQDFDIVHLLRRIIASFYSMEVDCNKNQIELHKNLKDILKRGDSFLVLDDVWNQKSELWDQLKAILIDLGVGKIIITTRNESVAKIMQTTSPIYLDTLSFDHCWLLFTKIVFGGRHHCTEDEYVNIGRKIVQKCGGLPLAVKVLASTLALEQDEDAWIHTLESELWELDDDDDKRHIFPALKLSYDRMPMKLKSCFMYLSLFPKDSILDRSTIIKQWMAQGFLHRGEEKNVEEDIGNAYYDELLQRSIIQCYERTSKEIFIMHDLIHDLAQSVARDDYLLLTSDQLYPIPKTIRHVSIYLKGNTKATNLKYLFESQLRKERLRTIILHSAAGFPIAHLLHNLARLRTLILNECEDSREEPKPLKLLDSIGNLKHIRYLHLDNTTFVPESFYKLYHLQTFRGSLSHSKSPGSIGDLINLRHIVGYDRHQLPLEIGWLTNLQTLRDFTVGEDSWRCKVRDLKHLDNIRGDFYVSGLETVNWSDVTPPEALLKTKPGIQELHIRWGGIAQPVSNEIGDEKLAKQVLECLEPHLNLVKLFIDDYPGAIFPMWLGGASFHKLQELHLSGGNCISLPTLGQLPYLKTLFILRMKRVRSVGRELLSCDPLFHAPSAAVEGTKSGSCCFPSLEELTFREMEEWVEWHGVDYSDFPCLRLLCIESCPMLQSLPSLSSLTELSIFFHGWSSELLSDSCCLPMLRNLNIIYHKGDTLSFLGYHTIRSLKVLVIRMSSTLKSITGLGNLISLELLAIEGCPSLRMPKEERLPPYLKNVRMMACPHSEEWYNNQVSGSSDHHNHQMEEITKHLRRVRMM